MEISPIRTQADLEAALVRMSALMDLDPQDGTLEFDEMLVLGTLIETFESEHFPTTRLIQSPIQRPPHPLYEVFTGTFVGMIGSWLITWLTFKYVATPSVAATVSVFFCTLWSLIRGYAIRRHFAKKIV